MGVIGGGRISQTQAIAALRSDRWEIVSGALSSDPVFSCDKASEWHIYPARAYLSLQEMAQAEAQRPDAIDAVMITTPKNLHFSTIKVFMEAGFDVICDKPLTNMLAEALGVSQALEKRDYVFAVCYTISCFPMIWHNREIVASGKFGQINQIHVEFMQDSMALEDAAAAPHVLSRLDPKVSGPASCVLDIGKRSVYFAQFVN